MYEDLTREELEARLSAAEEACGHMREHMKYTQPSIWRLMVKALRRWESLKESHDARKE